jgi:hypothetical protein
MLCCGLFVLPMSVAERYGCIPSCRPTFKNLMEEPAPEGVFDKFGTLVHCDFAEAFQEPAFTPGVIDLACFDWWK